jgi:thiol-disulfide isomerase/thioredoxin
MLSRFLLVLALSFTTAQAMASASFRTLTPSAPPSLALPDLSGTAHDIAQYQGKVVLVNFWAAWCPPCRREMPSMQRLKEKMSGRPFVILGVDSAEEREEVVAFLRLVKVDFPILLDPDSATTRRWKVFALPTSFLIDRNGKVRYSIAGPTEWDEGEALALIDSLLHEK